jgi:hypothetical protein
MLNSYFLGEGQRYSEREADLCQERKARLKFLNGPVVSLFARMLAVKVKGAGTPPSICQVALPRLSWPKQSCIRKGYPRAITLCLEPFPFTALDAPCLYFRLLESPAA